MFGAEWGYGGYTQFHLVVWIILLIAAVAGSSGAYDQVNRQNKNGAVASAVLVRTTRGPAHFDWLWRVRPVLALLCGTPARGPNIRLSRIRWGVLIYRNLIQGRLAHIGHCGLFCTRLLFPL
jgi:hypothetical protein